MTKFAISSEGSQAMETLSRQLEQNASEILMLSDDLMQKICSINGIENSLGIYYEEIVSLISENLKIIKDNRENLEYLGGKAKKQAEWIMCMVQEGLGDSGSIGGVLANSATKAVGGGSLPSKPENGVKPRSLDLTRFGYKELPDHCLLYDSPMETDKFLIQSQGKAYPHRFQGTCGLCACANILRMAGVDVSEKDMIDYAGNTKVKRINEYTGNEEEVFLCSKHCLNPRFSGGTDCYNRQKILEHFGIESECVDINPDDDSCLKQIADYVDNGKGVILSIHSKTLWNGMPNDGSGDHAVVVTSVLKTSAGNIIGFYICDTGRGEGTSYYPAERIRASLTPWKMNVTNKAVR